MLPQKYHDELPPLKNAAARMIFLALMDYVHNRRWSNGRRPKNKRDRSNKVIYEEARSWLFDSLVETCDGSDVDSEDDLSAAAVAGALNELEHLMSFESACGILGWDPQWLRDRIPSLNEEDLRRVAKKNGFL